jgi:Spy/CpxP family protein refolding chaperone
VTRAAAALALLVLAGPAAGAQEGREGGRRPGPPQDHVFKMVDSYFINNLKQRLDLTDEQLTRVVPHVQRLQSDRRELAQRRMRAMRELNRVLLSGTATEAAVRELLREVKAVEAEEPATLGRDREAIDAVLSPVQQAKYRLLEAEVERRVRHAMARARGGRRPSRAPRQAEPERQTPPN